MMFLRRSGPHAAVEEGTGMALGAVLAGTTGGLAGGFGDSGMGEPPRLDPAYSFGSLNSHCRLRLVAYRT